MDSLTRIQKEVLGPGLSEDEIEETLAVFDSVGIGVLFRDSDPDLPTRMLDGPEWNHLTFLGDKSSLTAPRIVGIVGRREPTDRGLQFAHDLAEALAKRETPTLSGMARGIDQAVHRGSLSIEGPTIAMLPEGILRFLRWAKPNFPSIHVGDSSPLLAVSGLAPNERWSVSEAMRRNRWIANWSDTLVVVEANPEGGTWRTAEAAAQAGKPIWVCEGLGVGPDGLGNDLLARTYRCERLSIEMDPEEAASLLVPE